MLKAREPDARYLAEAEPTLVEVLGNSRDTAGLRKLLVMQAIQRSACSPVTDADVPNGLPLNVRYMRLGQIAKVSKGPTGIKDAKPGAYPLVVTGELRASCDHWDFEGPAVIIPTVSSTGHGDASLKRIHYQDGKFAVGSILAAVQPRDGSGVSARFLYEYLAAFKDELLVARMSGTANVSLTVSKIEDVPIPVVEPSMQSRVEGAATICDALQAKGRLEAEQHARLLSTLLGTLTDSRSPEELAANWQRVATHFDLLLDRPEAVDALEDVVVQLAVRGVLTHQDPNEPAAESLVEGIRREREELVSRGETRLEKPSTLVDAAEQRFVAPTGWVWVRLEDISTAIVDCPHSTPRFVDSGLLCIDTNSFKSGALIPHKLRFVDEATFKERVERLKPEPGDLVFAREGSVGESLIIPPDTKACLGQRVMLFRLSRMVSNEFVRLAITSGEFLELLLSLHKGIGAKHVNVGDMRRAAIALPPLSEQRRIVARVTQLRRLCADLRQRLAASRATQSRLAEALIDQATA